ncbi:MAG: HIT domain-containing protein [Candidatus Levybacteria bacterium]|nr:HIT domain-containing protein [Candidatus Levybacteria bacterium]
MKGCVFCKIRDREIPKEFTYEDEDIMVFPDIYPLKPVHLLIIPKKHIKDFLEFEEGTLLGKLKKIIQRMIKKSGLSNKGYRLTINGGGAQIIDHLHIHLLGPLGKTAKM